MTIKTQCSLCSKPIKAGEQFIGKSVKCPGCGSLIRIPPTDGPALPAASPAAPPTSSFGPPPVQPPQAGAPPQFGGPAPFNPPQQFGPPASYGPAPQYGPPQQFGPPPQFGPPQQFGQPSPYDPPAPYGPPPQFGAPIGGIYNAQDMAVAPTAYEPDQGDRRPCPACRELIMRTAVKCRFCGDAVGGFSSTRAGRAYRKSEDDDLTTTDWLIAIFIGGIGCILGIAYMIQGKKKGGKMLVISILTWIVGNSLVLGIKMAANR